MIILSVSYVSRGQSKSQGTTETTKTDVALTFINDYVKHCNSGGVASNTANWIENNRQLTNEFKKSYKKLIDEATKEEP